MDISLRKPSKFVSPFFTDGPCLGRVKGPCAKPPHLGEKEVEMSWNDCLTTQWYSGYPWKPDISLFSHANDVLGCPCSVCLSQLFFELVRHKKKCWDLCSIFEGGWSEFLHHVGAKEQDFAHEHLSPCELEKHTRCLKPTLLNGALSDHGECITIMTMFYHGIPVC